MQSIERPPLWPGDDEPISTVAMLYQQFGDVLIPIETVRDRYFRNRNAETFRRALNSGDIGLPVVTLDDSAKTQRFVCIYQLAAYIEHQARQAAVRHQAQARLSTLPADDRELQIRMVDAIPRTEFPTAHHAGE